MLSLIFLPITIAIAVCKMSFSIIRGLFHGGMLIGAIALFGVLSLLGGIISAIFGLVDEHGIRQYREVFDVMDRKCGKSLLASGIAEYMVYADGEPGAAQHRLLGQTDGLLPMKADQHPGVRQGV